LTARTILRYNGLTSTLGQANHALILPIRRRIPMKHAFTASLVTVVALCGLTTPAQAQMPLSGNLSGDGVLTPVSPNVFHQVVTIEGDDALFGAFTGQSSSDIDFSDLSHLVLSNGMLTETFADGTLSGTSDGTGMVTTPGNGTFEADVLFTGGTGSFAGATGEAHITATFVRTSATTVEVSGSYVGALVPEPGALLLLTGLSLSSSPFLLRLRRKTGREPQRL
jgi:hypothetical protein